MTAVRILLVMLCLALMARPVRADQTPALIDAISETTIEQTIAQLGFSRAGIKTQMLASAMVTAFLKNMGHSVIVDPVSPPTSNLIVRIEGTLTPERVFVIGAHYDTAAGTPGADDNASGVGAMLAIAEVLATSGYQPTCSIELVAFALQESGMAGSIQYAQRAIDEGIDIVGMISLDTIAYTCAEPGCQTPLTDLPGCLDVQPEDLDVGTYILDLGNVASAALRDQFHQAAMTYVPELQVVTASVADEGSCFSESRASDHAPFWDAGFPALLITDTAAARNPHYHQLSDSIRTLDLPFARRVAQATLATLLAATGGDCPTDLDQSCHVDVNDLLIVLGAWGPCGTCPADVDGSGTVDVGDLLTLLIAWGPCN